ncbi:UDP-N-acetylglucosamine 1-carboxyvinyltransferase [Nocardiopsis sp. RSe5-2]|uniref:UDP-N-acetylglucosamine 1-carboxyvinyltransferase n=1 Tax=Nocardiopsis endophytica TaxID=3018445 RepID=A0ABT4TY55_9ACTN|nr:UDP-N-acetylglucosamine 1-carboxyvinyltransferase [Nocardiopsis endophytica]MDA2809620.1 UDP-N-acetylglucosamine 1-carboxyvinyltransferase [Nocardiopsis endophytica]
MRRLLITGETSLAGRIHVQGSKNVFLHLAAASLLASRPVRLRNAPAITDTRVCVEIARALGAHAEVADAAMTTHAADLRTTEIPGGLGTLIRPTACFGAAVLARTGAVTFPFPGGDAFAERLIDRHLAAMQAVGAEIRVSDGFVHARARRLAGFTFDASTDGHGPSLGATISALLLGAMASGASRISGASVEPEVEHTVGLLRCLGVPVSWEGTSTLEVEGRPPANGATYTVPPDRMVAGTYAIAAAMTEGRIDLAGVALSDFPTGFLKVAATAGLDLAQVPHGIRATRSEPAPVEFETGPHPEYPTDLQPQLCALLTQAPGTSKVAERVYSRRATHIPGLASMGADIRAVGDHLTIVGPRTLSGATVRGTDIRAAAALVLAALAASGRTELAGVEHLYRGYENLPGTLRSLGAAVMEHSQEEL